VKLKIKPIIPAEMLIQGAFSDYEEDHSTFNKNKFE
jgi:hypothetical protein